MKEAKLYLYSNVSTLNEDQIDRCELRIKESLPLKNKSMIELFRRSFKTFCCFLSKSESLNVVQDINEVKGEEDEEAEV